MSRIRKETRVWAALAIAFATTLVIVTAASADTGYATASVTQTSPGYVVASFGLPECAPIVGVAAPGFRAVGETFSGPFGDVGGKSKEAKLLEKSAVDVVQDAVICVISADGTFYGYVNGTATISRQDNSGRNVLTAGYGSFITGTINALGGINVQWLPGGSYTITGVSGTFAKSFEVGETGTAAAAASSPWLGAPETGTLQISFDFEAK